MMKDLLIRLSRERQRRRQPFVVARPKRPFREGQLVCRRAFCHSFLTSLTGDDLKIRDVSMGDDGTIHLTAAVGSNWKLGYKLKIERFSAATGGRTTFSEERKGGGLGGALLGMTGKN